MNVLIPQIWHHICPKPIDLAVSLHNGFAKIEIPKGYLIQGVEKDIPSFSINYAQMGMICRHEVVVNPTKGSLYYMSTGWLYKGLADEFYYVLTCNGQSSEAGLVTIT